MTNKELIEQMRALQEMGATMVDTASAASLCDRLEAAEAEIERLRNKWWEEGISEMGVYPQAIRGAGELDYEERSQFQNGWNACVIEYAVMLTKLLNERPHDQQRADSQK